MFYTNLTHENFNDISNTLLNYTTLNVLNHKFRICEIEMYLKNDEHNDEYVHQRVEQQEFQKFYFHKFTNGTFKNGTFKGFDITLGDERKYFGILIRSILNLETDEFIEGPCLCVNEILKIFNFHNVKQLHDFLKVEQIDIFNENINLQNEIHKNEIIYAGPRIGLSDKYLDFRDRHYRYVIFKDKIKKKRKTLMIL
jgi:hypothetical protein